MAERRDRPHIQVPVDGWREKQIYTAHGGGGPGKQPGEPPGGRAAHADRLRRQIAEALIRAAEQPPDLPVPPPGIRLEFESFPGWELALAEMESRRSPNPAKQIEVIAVTEALESLEPPGAVGPLRKVQRAAVFIPEGQVEHFLKQLERYALETPKAEREKRHEKVYDRIAQVRLAVLRSLWTDVAELWPASEETNIWWEVWLRRTDGHELERLHLLADRTGLRIHDRRIQFDDRIVTLVFASQRQLTQCLGVLNDLAELQRARELATFFVGLDPAEQAAWALDLRARLQPPPAGVPAVCVLDTGINAGHPLIEGALSATDCHALDPAWGSHDHNGHGTQMAGLALYGDLVPHLESRTSVVLEHRLESVKIERPRGEHPPDLYAAVTAEAVSLPEIEAPDRRRVFSLAITAGEGRDRGKPTSWSSAMDALAAGRSFDASQKGLTYLDEPADAAPRLFVVSAGNVDPGRLQPEHLERSDLECVQDPAHAWNVLSVGAFTEKTIIIEPMLAGWTPVAPRGDLAPSSTTSVPFMDGWPIKPEIVLEGGNLAREGTSRFVSSCDDLSLLTTHFQPAEKLFTASGDTSAAAAQAARLCAQVSAAWPGLWPETLRALVVHSARWTPSMLAHFRGAKDHKGKRASLVRRYGYGVPALERALKSATNAATLVVQDVIDPFQEGKLKEIHVHRLPWPKDVLLALDAETVRLRVALSYFIEPNPGRRGWQKRHRYASHGLRFALKKPDESAEAFVKRMNKEALEDEEKRPDGKGASDRWFLGPNARDLGSLHVDVWEGSAVELAACDMLAVYPVGGWWKDQPKRDRSALGARYALVISIETDAEGVDLWTPIAQQVGLEVEVAT